MQVLFPGDNGLMETAPLYVEHSVWNKHECMNRRQHLMIMLTADYYIV